MRVRRALITAIFGVAAIIACTLTPAAAKAATSHATRPLAGNTSAGQVLRPGAPRQEAAARSSTAPRTVRPDGVGVGVGINIPAVTMFQCPATNCNQGLAIRGDNIADICYLPWDGYGGGYWNLLLDHNNNEVGFTASHWLTGTLTTQHCSSAGESA